jgi:hypothetical protein
VALLDERAEIFPDCLAGNLYPLHAQNAAQMDTSQPAYLADRGLSGRKQRNDVVNCLCTDSGGTLHLLESPRIFCRQSLVRLLKFFDCLFQVVEHA